MLNKDKLCNAVFYPACGGDLQPLVRFSHLSSTFIYVDYGISENEIENYLAEVIEILNKQIAPGKLDIISSEPISKADLSDTEPTLPLGFILRRYLDPEEVREKLSQTWAKRFNLKRKFANVVRNLQLIYIYGEGLATYSALYRGGKLAPKILVTVKSGVAFGGNYTEFEDGRGIFADFLDACEEKPIIWVRGTGGYGVDTSGSWNNQIQGYANWHINNIHRSHVAAFRRNEYNLDIESEKKLDGTHGRILHLKRGEITSESVGNAQNTLTIISSTILRRWKQINPKVNFQYGTLSLPSRWSGWRRGISRWGNLNSQVYVYKGGTISLLSFLNEIDKICTDRELSHVITVPQGFEDEGEALLSWVEGDGLPQKLEIVFTDELDFASLMGCSLAQRR